MKIYEVRERTPQLLAELLEIWEASVRATHLFLSDAEVNQIKEYVPQALGGVEHLMIARDDSSRAIGFMGTENGRLEMLFLSPTDRGKGMGRALVQYGILNYGVREVTVNEQNPQAVLFYRHLGFETYKRTDHDEEGNPYPLLYMKLVKDVENSGDQNREIRTAKMRDLEAIAKIEAACFPAAEAATKEEFAQRLQYYGNHFWLMCEGDKIIAFVDGFVTDEKDLSDEMYENAAMHDEKGAWQMIFGVNTLPSYRKKGYAGQLIERAIEDARKQGRKGLVLTCKDKLVSYYAKFGFQNEGTTDKSVHGGVTWNQMRLTF